MRILLLDDQPPYFNSVWIPRLRQRGHEVVFHRRLGSAFDALSQDSGFDLVVLDLLMDHEPPPGLASLSGIVSAALRSAGHPGETTAQALGLWLWRQRRPYCYLTAYPILWRPELDSPPEFVGATPQELKFLVCEKGSEGKAPDFVEGVHKLWMEKLAGGWKPMGQP